MLKLSSYVFETFVITLNGEGAEADPGETAGEEAHLTVQMFSKHYCNLVMSLNCHQVANCSSVAKVARERIYCQTDGFDFLPSAKTTLSEGTLFFIFSCC